MRILAAIAIVMALTACAAPPPRLVTTEIDVPVPCNPKIPSKPSWSVDALPIGAMVDEQMRALRADRVKSLAYTDQLIFALQSCDDDKL